VPTVIEQRADLNAAPRDVFAFLTDPASRGEWDSSCERCTIEGDAPAKGVRLHIAGRRAAPSWTGEYGRFDLNRGAALRLVEGLGMPFTSFIEGFQVEARKGGCRLTLRVEYEVSGMLRMIEPLTVRSRMRRTTAKSLRNVEQHFAYP
jgi:carbon monoxide dehydrogenase subunit G